MGYFNYNNSTVLSVGSIFLILNIIARWRLFKKAGRWGFSALIPIYSDIVLCGIVRISPLWLICFLIPVFNIFFGICYYGYMSIKLAIVFGKSGLFGLGLLFFNPIFVMILGFGDSEYIYRSR